MDQCDETHIRQAARGDQEAFRHLWEAHHGAAMAAALRLCHRRSLAEEITQGAFLLAWRGLPHFQPGRPFRPWLMRILYRHALDTIEQQKIYLQPLSLEQIGTRDLQIPDERCKDPQEHIAQREEIRRVLAQLSPDQRRVIALRYGADLTELDISEVLGWPLGTVKSRLNRARALCRVLLEESR